MEKQKSIICRGWNKTCSQTYEVTKCPRAPRGAEGMLEVTGSPCLVAPGAARGTGTSGDQEVTRYGVISVVQPGCA